jgi:hypothetical protein
MIFKKKVPKSISIILKLVVACAIGPSVNTIFIFHIFKIENFEI